MVQKVIKSVILSSQLKFWKVWFSKKEETICQMNAFGLVFYFAYIFPYFVENHTLQNISLNDTITLFVNFYTNELFI